MSDSTATQPRRPRIDTAPPSVLDPFVTDLLRWIERQEKGVNPNTMAKQAAAAIGWPLPFAEAVVVAARGRRLLTMLDVTVRGGYRSGLSERGRAWLSRLEHGATEPATG
jgi:hypothetical protein